MTSEKSIYKIVSSVELGKISVCVTDSNVFIINIEKDTEVTLNVAKEVIAAMEQIADGRKMPVLIIAKDYSLPTKEAREFLADKDASPYASAEAYVISSMAQRIIGNFYLNVNKPQRPTRLFNKVEEALAWLELFKWV